MSLQTKKQVLGWENPENATWRAWRQPWNCYHRFDESGYFHFHPRTLQLWNHGIVFPARWRLCGFNLPIETKGWLMESNNPWILAFSRLAALQEECPEVPDAGCPWQEYLLHETWAVRGLQEIFEDDYDSSREIIQFSSTLSCLEYNPRHGAPPCREVGTWLVILHLIPK